MLKVPEYIKEILKGATTFEFPDKADRNDDFAVGYTIAIYKRSRWQTADTFKKDIHRLQKWVNSLPGGDCRVLSVPDEMFHCQQKAVVTIFDPIMLYLENQGIIG